jgi:hypothetical protein
MYFSRKKLAFCICIGFIFGLLSLFISFYYKSNYIFKATISIPLFEGHPIINTNTYSKGLKHEILDYIHSNPECNSKKVHDFSIFSKRLNLVISKDKNNQIFIYFRGNDLVQLDKCFNSLLIFIDNDLFIKTNPFFLKINKKNSDLLNKKNYILNKISSHSELDQLGSSGYFKLLLLLNELDLVEANIFNNELIKFKDKLDSPKTISSITSKLLFSLTDRIGLFFLSCLSGFIVGFIFINRNRYCGVN